MDRRGFIRRTIGCVAALLVPKASAAAPKPEPIPIDTTNELWSVYPSLPDVDLWLYPSVVVHGAPPVSPKLVSGSGLFST